MDYLKLFENSILVVAHLDDEALWFSSILEHVSCICFSYLDYSDDSSLSEGRRNALANYPMSNIKCLEIEEPRSFDSANWNNPIESNFGLKLTKNKAADSRYIKSYQELVGKLEVELKGFSNVFTHNPWGEYGHEDHVQTFRAIQSLSSKLGYKIWYSNYCGNRSIPLMLRYISGFETEYFTLETNTNMANKLLELYKSNSCWTWYNNYQWFKQESFMQMSLNNDIQIPYGQIFPLNIIKTDFDKKETILSKARKKIRLLKNSGKH